MKNPFKNVSLNTEKVYVRGTTQSGCHVYLPIDSLDDADQQTTKKNLQAYLDTQPGPPIPEPEAA